MCRALIVINPQLWYLSLPTPDSEQEIDCNESLVVIPVNPHSQQWTRDANVKVFSKYYSEPRNPWENPKNRLFLFPWEGEEDGDLGSIPKKNSVL